MFSLFLPVSDGAQALVDEPGFTCLDSDRGLYCMVTTDVSYVFSNRLQASPPLDEYGAGLEGRSVDLFGAFGVALPPSTCPTGMTSPDLS